MIKQLKGFGTASLTACALGALLAAQTGTAAEGEMKDKGAASETMARSLLMATLSFLSFAPGRPGTRHPNTQAQATALPEPFEAGAALAPSDRLRTGARGA